MSRFWRRKPPSARRFSPNVFCRASVFPEPAPGYRHIHPTCCSAWGLYRRNRMASASTGTSGRLPLPIALSVPEMQAYAKPARFACRKRQTQSAACLKSKSAFRRKLSSAKRQSFSAIPVPAPSSTPWPRQAFALLWNQGESNVIRMAALPSADKRFPHTTPKSIRGRLLSYLSDQALRTGSRTFTIPFDHQQLAGYLNVDRASLSSELENCSGRVYSAQSAAGSNSSAAKKTREFSMIFT